jgi:hypothetical protein
MLTNIQLLAWPPQNPGIPLCFSPYFATPPSYVNLFHFAFLSLWKTLLPFGRYPYLPCFDQNFSLFGIKSPKEALQDNVAQRKKVCSLGS